LAPQPHSAAQPTAATGGGVPVATLEGDEEDADASGDPVQPRASKALKNAFDEELIAQYIAVGLHECPAHGRGKGDKKKELTANMNKW